MSIFESALQRAVRQTAMRLIEEAFDSRFWRDIRVRGTPDEVGNYVFSVRGAIDAEELYAAFQKRRSSELKAMVPKHAEEIVAKLSRQRWIGPYRWRK